MSTDVARPAPAGYRFSALLKALAVMWRSSGPALLFIVINTVVQGFLTWLNTQSALSFGFLVAVLVSGISVMALYAVLTSCALGAVDRDGESALGRVKAHAGAFTGWALLQWLLVLLVTLIHPVLVLLVAALTPFLSIAAMDGQSNALAVNFRTLGGKFWRWLVTSVILLVAGVIYFLLAAVDVFFIKGTPAAIFFWLAIGVVAWWLLTAWTLVYRAARAEDAGES
ncbi:MAG: hypothetical protein H6526_00250 [Actinobacteria bacterium]|nr:hypothetical protein [Actinomycetota bacterium]MCB8998045.1 hypothetical protein [Actinomycetota bacterium]MCB9413697.1 hypothetical protein [Actinomycetota bacterium]MCB9424675.1 hypothetical protein [Actinomycetota bacterium]